MGIIIRGRPCKVIDMSTSKTGKHGHAKVHFVATDIFTGKKLEDIVPSTHTTTAPFVKRNEYQLIDIDGDEQFASLMLDDGSTKDDLQLKPDDDTCPQQAVHKEICDGFENGLDLLLTVQAACGEEAIISMKEIEEKRIGTLQLIGAPSSYRGAVQLLAIGAVYSPSSGVASSRRAKPAPRVFVWLFAH